MAGTHITTAQKTKALTLRAAGYTIATISDKTNVSVSTLKRLFKEHLVKRGDLKKAVIDKATSELLNDCATVEAIKRETASLILDDLAMVKRLREAMASAMEVLEASDTSEALQVMRAVSAGAVALKSTSETLRKSLGLDKESDVSVDLPELVISVLTEAEMENIRNDARTLSVGFDDEAGGVLEHFEDEVIIEGIDELDTTSG
jgi:AraC-like DNA-binding protein